MTTSNGLSTVTLSRTDIISRIRAFRPMPGRSLETEVDSLSCIQFRDAIELYARLRGARSFLWRDPAGRTVASEGILHNAVCLARDAIAFPFILARYHRLIGRLAASAGVPSSAPRHDSAGPFEPKRALYLRSDHWFNIQSGGSVGHVSGVIAGLRRAGIETDVISTDVLTGVPEDRAFKCLTPEYGVCRNISGFPELLYTTAMVSAASEQLQHAPADFIYQRMSFNNFAGAWLRALTSVPFVCEYNGSFAWMQRHWGTRPLPFESLALAAEDLSLQAADLVVAVSDASRAELIERGYDPDKVLANPNGVDPNVYNPGVDGSGIRSQLGLIDRTVFGFIGTFGRWHGADVLIQAFACLLNDRPELREQVHLLMIGDGLTKAEVERLAQDMCVAGNVTFTGAVPQARGPAHLAACDVLVSPHVPNSDGSRFFGSPTKLFEYMAMGRAIVASDVEQIGTVLQHQETAILAPPGDVGELARALLELVGSPERRVELGAAARAAAIAHYTWDRHTARIVDALSDRLGTPLQ